MDIRDFLSQASSEPEDETKSLWVRQAPKPFWIVEPHADDAYLSLGDFIQRNSSDVTILTVFSGTRKRADDARKYAEAVGAKWEGMGYVESNVGVQTDEVLDPPFDRSHFPSTGTLILPLGVRHPEHRALATLRKEGDYSYLETPYQLRLKNSLEAYRLLFGRTLVYWNKPGWQSKFKYHDLFKDQSLFMYRNPPKDLSGAVEVIVK